ncbi:cyclic nucleotide-binding domain-containing protein [Roseospira marina]|uniref:Cyclic nucleotide-binding domain-containing protein n=1 Tax=Roseospira marina TaxID=140057 RepID=A0A5M6IFL4_9PROT|nr:ABC transporter transmembrane domain-containing protein [Roseospira marina]KAA5607090.1 cyclic nucleotide-binding domain-containing protein [Roseospira marina]MBB4312717.1 ABC-type multidrug transport system fused ATPase/permease subunit [Roseospira marina]MBB5086510.1 ABC-type multidrug transport system fused ATPase/permease subunit [Roseospira marina]
MPPSVFSYVWRFSRFQQIRILLLSVVSFPFLYLSFEVPKMIVNDAIGGGEGPRRVLGWEMSQIEYLWLLSGAFLALVLTNGGLKYVIQVYKGVIAERMLRRLRYMLIAHVLRFPLPHFRSVSAGQTVSMISQESEPLGGFFGDSFALPAFQGGILLTILAFMFAQDPVLGVAAISLYPVQVWLIPKLQRRVNRLNKERVKALRHMSDRIGETVTGVTDIRVNNTERFELANFSSILHRIFFIRFDIYRYKFLIKFLNNFFAQLTPFLFYAIGGYLVIKGDLSIGALVAVLAAYKDIYAPWKELLTYYQTLEDARVRYGVLTEQFIPPDLLPESRMGPASETAAAPISLTPDSELVLGNGVVEHDDGTRPLDGATLSLRLNEHIAILGHSGSGRPELAQVLAGLQPLSRGRLTLDGRAFDTLPPALLGRAIAYVDHDPSFRAGTLGDALYYGLRREPQAEEGDICADGTDASRATFEAALSGNSTERPDVPWLDPDDEAGTDTGALHARALEVLRVVGLGDDVLALGQRARVDPTARPTLADTLLRARRQFASELELEGASDLVERFHPDRYNRNATVAANLVFGLAREQAGGPLALAGHPAFREALAAVDLLQPLLDVGLRVAKRMVELFHDLPPGHEFFDRYSFFDVAKLDDHVRLIREARSKGPGRLPEEDQALLRSLTLGLIPARHRLGLLGEDAQARIVAARPRIREVLSNSPQANGLDVVFLDPDAYHPYAAVRVNVLFGRVAADRPDAERRVQEIVTRVLDRNDLAGPLTELGLETEIGVGGRRLSTAQRQKLAIARGLMKRPRLMVLNSATGALDSAGREALASALTEHMDGRALVWADSEAPGAAPFGAVYELADGKVRGRPDAAPTPAAPESDQDTRTPSPALDDDESAALASEAALLKRLAFFANLDASTLKLIAFTSSRVVYRSGEVLMRQGEPGDDAHVIVEGTAEVLVERDGRETSVAERGPGDLIGELALLCDAPRSATVRASTPLETLLISRDVLVRLLEDNPQVGASLTRTIANRLEDVMRQLSGG